MAQMGLITLGIFANNDLGFNGSVLQMVNHGLISASLFLLAGMVERRAATGELALLGGMARGRPALATVLMTTGVIALAVPLSTAFAGEFLILAGVFQQGWGWAVVGAISIVLAAMYVLRLISAVLHEKVGAAVSEAARTCAPGSLGRRPLVGILIALSAWPTRSAATLRRRARERGGRERAHREAGWVNELASGTYSARRVGPDAFARGRAEFNQAHPNAAPGVRGAVPGRRHLRITVTGSSSGSTTTRTVERGVIGAIVKPHVDWFALAPTLALLAATGVLLLMAVLVPRRARKPASAIVCAAGYVGAFVLAILLADESPNGGPIVADAIFRDRWAATASIIVAGCGVVAVGVSYGERWRENHVGEYYALLAAAGAGMVFFVSASNFMTLFLGLEWFSISLYVLCAIDYDLVGALEAGLKYLVVGAVGRRRSSSARRSPTERRGLSFDKIAAAGNTHDSLLVLGLAMMIAGFAFKASAAPFHMWTPDAYQGAPTPVTGFMSSATKVAALAVTYRVLVTAFPQDARIWTWAIAAIAIASLAVGNIAALTQRNVKRLLAYSSVSHAGFMLIAVASDNGSARGR